MKLNKVYLIIACVLIIIFIVIYGNFYSNFSKFDKIVSVPDLSNRLYNGNELDGYRLADVIFYPDYLTSKHKYSTIDHLYKFPNTIGTKYIKRKYPFLQKINNIEDIDLYKIEYNAFENQINNNLKDGIDIEILNSIINEVGIKKNNVDDKTLFLHIRVGDVLCKYEGMSHAFDYAKKGNTVWWDSVLDYIKSNDINNIIIISGTHFKDCLMESANYLEDRKKFLQAQGVNVSYRIGNSPDEDLIFCKDAKHFITTGGGYGYFLGKIIELNGGKFVLNNKDTIRKEVNLFKS